MSTSFRRLSYSDGAASQFKLGLLLSSITQLGRNGVHDSVLSGKYRGGISREIPPCPIPSKWEILGNINNLLVFCVTRHILNGVEQNIGPHFPDSIYFSKPGLEASAGSPLCIIRFFHQFPIAIKCICSSLLS